MKFQERVIGEKEDKSLANRAGGTENTFKILEPIHNGIIK